MRTRRSPRNQMILWRALGGKPEPPPQPAAADLKTDAEIDRMFWLSKTSRNLLKKDMAKRRRTLADHPVTLTEQ